jgi:FtsP/CotA-like multicopper oxidase with cupredoxin domain
MDFLLLFPPSLPPSRPPAGNYFIVNGQYQPKLTTAPDEFVRLRLVNAGFNDYLLLQLPGCEVGREGGREGGRERD